MGAGSSVNYARGDYHTRPLGTMLGDNVNGMSQALRAIGLMSGTSMDGVDAAYVETDGAGTIKTGAAITVPFDPGFRARLKAFVAAAPDRGAAKDEAGLEAELTDLHAAAVAELQKQLGSTKIDLVGFHGQTIWHRPEKG